MPCDYRIDTERRLVRSRAWGKLTNEELQELQRQLLQDPLFSPECWQLFDAIEVTSVSQVTSDAAQAMARRHIYGPRSRRAIVTRPGATYGLARMFQTYRELAGGHEQIRVFEDLKEAEAWLGLGPGADPA
jgi:hypothetical protein